jgi:hypothetical protein
MHIKMRIQFIRELIQEGHADQAIDQEGVPVYAEHLEGKAPI